MKDIVCLILMFCPAIGIIVYQHVSHEIGSLIIAFQCIALAVPMRMLHDKAKPHQRFWWTMLGLCIFVTGILICLYGMVSVMPADKGLHVPDHDVNTVRHWMPFIIVANLLLTGTGTLLVLDAIRNKYWRHTNVQG